MTNSHQIITNSNIDMANYDLNINVKAHDIDTNKTTVLWFYSGIISGWWCYDDVTNENLNNMYINYCKKNGVDYSDFINIDIKPLSEVTNEFVDFNNIADQPILSNGNLIKTTHGNYVIDFNKMIQQSTNDINKKRKIMYAVVQKNIFENKNKLKEYLITKSVKGIAGIKF